MKHLFLSKALTWHLFTLIITLHGEWQAPTIWTYGWYIRHLREQFAAMNMNRKHAELWDRLLQSRWKHRDEMTIVYCKALNDIGELTVVHDLIESATHWNAHAEREFITTFTFYTISSCKLNKQLHDLNFIKQRNTIKILIVQQNCTLYKNSDKKYNLIQLYRLLN